MSEAIINEIVKAASKFGAAIFLFFQTASLATLAVAPSPVDAFFPGSLGL